MVTRLVLLQAYVKEIYHPNYRCKAAWRLGAVLGAAQERKRYERDF